MLTPRADRRAFVDEILLDSWALPPALRFEDVVPVAQKPYCLPPVQFLLLLLPSLLTSSLLRLIVLSWLLLRRRMTVNHGHS